MQTTKFAPEDLRSFLDDLHVYGAEIEIRTPHWTYAQRLNAAARARNHFGCERAHLNVSGDDDISEPTLTRSDDASKRT